MRVAFLAFLLSGLLVAARTPQDGPLPPDEAPKRITVPQGFKVTLFAGEPDVVQPMAFTFDDRGRLWVVECLSYPKWLPPGEAGRDRIVIFEDTDGDGKIDTKKIFADQLANVSGIALGHRGFITNCVIKHAFQVIPGAHFERMFGEDKSAPAIYGLIQSPADHIHWAGGAWQDSRGGDKHSDAGGGHAHVGAMVYLGDNWPE